MPPASSAWIVLKFGGSSVSSLPNWNNIASVAAARAAGGARVLIVHSAISGITDRLECLLDAAIGQAQEDELRAIEECHRRLASELAIPLGAEVQRALAEYFLTGVKNNIVLHKNILIHPAFLEGTYTTQFIDQQIAGKQHRELFMFVDEPVFLIAAAIEAYNQSKSRDVGDYNVASQWKKYGRMKSMRN